MSRHCFVLFAASLLLACTARRPEPPIQRYQLRGVVVRVDPARKTAVIKHEAIAGWMEAMTMEFPVRDSSAFESLAKGQSIRATVNVQDLEYWLSGIQQAPATSVPSP
jgi:protein SCO1/2